ncbi:MAG: phosphofructokinase, partial [Desulfobacterales bacterium]|nr:phosphofructokinase [Desulfobacterales bacterium]
RMVALCQGRYTALDLAELKGGAKRVDVENLYDAQAYRPNIRSVEGKPMFLY